MNKITKRVVAGISAAALFVSALGSDALISLFNPTTYAASSSGSGVIGKDKNGQSTGFDNLEQDTLTVADGTTYYNTGYGLHTNKTASTAGEDGRTFDVNLESWYVGENPVDVATILDASGSMAWTVDTLKPLEIKYSDLGDPYDTYEKLKAIQDKNGGYLPQDVVDLILDKTKTDDSKLSYSDYMYYVYESRSTVSEFVPLGYWDGGAATTKLKPIGYYPFDGSLKNEVNGNNASYIKQATAGGAFDEESKATITPQVVFSDGYLDLSETDQNGNLVIDLCGKLDVEQDITISFELSCVKLASTKTPQTPIIYLGDGTNSNYLALMRGRCHDDGAGAQNHLYIYDSGADDNTNKLKPTGSDTADNKALDSNYSPSCTLTISKGSASNYNVTLKVGNGTFRYVTNFVNLDSSKLYLVVGGDEILPKGSLLNKAKTEEVIDPKNLKGTADKNVSIRNLEISGSNGSGTISETFALNNAAGLTSSDKDTVAKYCQQRDIGSTEISLEEQETVEAEPEYNDKALNLTQTAKNGAVLLDVEPSKSSFTLSFKVKKAADDTTPKPESNILYMGSMDTSQDYYRIFRDDGTSSNRFRMRKKNNDSDNYVDINNVFKDGAGYTTITIVFDGKKVTQYANDVVDTTYNSLSDLDSELTNIYLILGGLFDSSYNGADIFIDDLYVFDEALEPDEVALVAQNQLTVVPSAKPDGCEGYHATSNATGKDIAQISTSLGQNPNDDERAGWYYVNSHSKWADIAGCLAGGKQYLGLLNDIGLAKYSEGIKPSEIDPKGNDETSSTKKWEIVKPTDYENDNKSIATMPSVYQAAFDTSGNEEYRNYYDKIIAGNDESKTFTAVETERSIQFYIDSQGYLRCFFCTGDLSWKSTEETVDKVKTTYWNYSPRTFCSVVYVKEKYEVEKRIAGDDNYGNPTKYEELNYALNQFYAALAENSDLSNSAIVRFSTHNLIEEKKAAANEKTKEHFKSLIMKDWTNYSDKYSASIGGAGGTLERKDYLQGLLNVRDKESTDSDTSSAKRTETIEEYPYVMTGGTYTWTGLKAFYDNMVDTKDKTSGHIVYDIANDARDKYLIIFTDGRDNTQDYNLKGDGTPDYNTGSGFTKKDYVGQKDYNPYYDTTHTVGVDNHTIETDGDLAEAWADKLKEEGYTIYCVMMATGSISPTANKDEYNRANNFLLQLAGSSDLEEKRADLREQLEWAKVNDSKQVEVLQKQLDNLDMTDANDHIIIVDPSKSKDEDGTTVTDAFQQILEQIQLPRNDYTVQDYIDPRFDLIGEAYVGGNDKPQEVIYHLGANGKITFTDTNNKTLDTITVTNPNGTNVTLTSGTTVNNIIDNIGKTGIVGLPYTPMESYMVNRKAVKVSVENPDGYDKGDNIGTGYIYYDDVKDMYYLRWTDQIIPMENEAFDTATDPEGKKLDVWSATIRLKAKDDFIGGNNILTNGNEAGENLVYSDATIENMDKGKNYELYGFTEGDLDSDSGKVPYRKKLEALSGTNRKINAVDADGVSQAVYGDGIDIPSSGFPRTTVNVRLLKLDANNLNDVIYMGEVVSPTMMLADLENGYMTGSYYLQYLERYAYRVYGEKADEMPLIELLNKWLKIDNDKEAAKTFTIPYIYLPDPEYGEDGKLEIDEGSGKVKIQNSTGASWKDKNIDFTDLNLRDVTGFITYTWKRDDGSIEPQQEMEGVAGGKKQYDITKDYVVKNTNQIVYNLQLKFTPLKETTEELSGFTLDTHFIEGEGSELGDKFFNINANSEFAEMTTDGEWTIDYDRTDYLQAMIKEERTYEPHVMYDIGNEKWKLIGEDDKTVALEKYAEDPQIEKVEDGKITDHGVYDWDNAYKPDAGDEQIESGKSRNYYTNTPDNVKVEGFSLVANTTYTKDVVNAALALELFVDGKYLNKADSKIKTGNTFTFEATRYYNDPIDPLPYDSTETSINADTGETDPTSGKVKGKNYKLTFEVTGIPDDVVADEIYRVWARLDKVEVEDASGYVDITEDATADNPYLGYDKPDALPIGTYVIDTTTNELDSGMFKIADINEGGSTETLYFKYLKIDNDVESYTHGRFPDNVSSVSGTAVTSTGDGEYQIWDDSVDYSKKNIAENNRTKDTDTQTVTFYFGTVKDDSGDKGKSVKDYLKDNPEATSSTDFTSDYAKDRLGIITLSADNNSLAISKKVTNTDEPDKTEWKFKVTVKPDTAEDVVEFETQNSTGFGLKWYKLEDGTWKLDETSTGRASTIMFDKVEGSEDTYTATITLKHGEKVVISGLQDGTWQVEEEKNGTLLYTPHNNANGEENWEYVNSNITSADVQLNPASHVDFVNEFPYELPSAGGFGIVIFVVLGSLLSAAAVIFFVLGRRKAGYSAGGKECG